MMAMFFYYTSQVYYLFQNLESDSALGLFFGCFCCFLITLIPPFLNRAKSIILKPNSGYTPVSNTDSHNKITYIYRTNDLIHHQHTDESNETCHKNTPSIPARLLLSFFYFLQCIISSIVMLLFMTFNLWVFITLVLGMTIGYFVFESKNDFGHAGHAGHAGHNHF